jgi:hypothetical protein
MSKLGRFWNWLLPGLICLCPMGALAYYNANATYDAPNHAASSRRWDPVSHPLAGTTVIPFARS